MYLHGANSTNKLISASAKVLNSKFPDSISEETEQPEKLEEAAKEDIFVHKKGSQVANFLKANEGREGKYMIDGGLTAEANKNGTYAGSNGKETKQLVYLGDGFVLKKRKNAWTVMDHKASHWLKTNDGTVPWSGWLEYGDPVLELPLDTKGDLLKKTIVAIDKKLITDVFRPNTRADFK